MSKVEKIVCGIICVLSIFVIVNWIQRNKKIEAFYQQHQTTGQK